MANPAARATSTKVYRPRGKAPVQAVKRVRLDVKDGRDRGAARLVRLRQDLRRCA